MTKHSDILKRAKKLIENPRNWTSGTLHRRTDGQDKYCALGAIQKVRRGTIWFGVEEAYNNPTALFIKGLEGVSAHFVNDHKGHAATMAMFDRAIAKAEALEAEEREAKRRARREMAEMLGLGSLVKKEAPVCDDIKKVMENG